MSEQLPFNLNAGPPVPQSLHELALMLRSARHLEPETRQELADLMDELAKAMAPPIGGAADLAHLRASAAHLAQVLHQPPEPGLLAAAKERLQDAVLRAEADAPLATGLARRIIEALANLGI